MTDESNAEEEPGSILYAVRLTHRARRDADAARERFAEISGESIADAWEDGLYQAIATLSQLPNRFSAVPESNRFGSGYGPVRQLLYQRRPGSPTYRVLYIVNDGKPDDAPFVNILHLRHGAARPITLSEARSIVNPE